MQKRSILIFLVGLMFLQGCSIYHGDSTQPALGPQVEEVHTLPTQGQGPTLSERDQFEETISPLELEDEATGQMNPEIVIATDIHYLAKELTDFGPAFEEMVQSGDGKAITYVWEITDAFLEEVIARKPQALILSGDLTLEGEQLSHEALAKKLKRVEDSGISVFVIPGNHDINNPWAAAYKGTEAIPAARTSPEKFVSIYGDFGYDEALSRDPASLSYLAELDDGTWLLMLDSCQYKTESLVGGMIQQETYSWIEKVLDDAWYEKRQVIPVAHHNLLDESRVYEENCTIEHSEELGKMLGGWDIRLFLSGHLHVQHYRSSDEWQVSEIVTGSLSMSPCTYGVLKYFGPEEFYYHTERVDVSAWASKKGNPDINLQNFESYADEFLQSIFYKQAEANLEKYSLSANEKQRMAEVYALLNVYAVEGRAWQIRDEMMKTPAYEIWQRYDRTDILCMYMNEIIEDAVCDYNVFSRH